MQYANASWHRPYGSRVENEEALGSVKATEEREEWWLAIYVCVNEEAQGPPALGAEPPERFRQRGATR
jgi:hypothetical protein